MRESINNIEGPIRGIVADLPLFLNEMDQLSSDLVKLFESKTAEFLSKVSEAEERGRRKGSMEGFAKFAVTMTHDSAGLLADRLQEANAIRELAYEYGVVSGIKEAVEAMSLELIEYNEKDEREGITPADFRTGYNLAVYKLKAIAEDLINDL